MHEPGPLLAAGRDADVFEYGPGLVLRRQRQGRSIAHEALTMDYLRAQGYPVPAVEEVSPDGSALVLERIDGVSMVDAIARRPWTLWRQGRTLASLHAQLHALEVPDFLPPAPVGRGTSIVHLDLHPLNVMIGPKGPVVIDWTGASVGDPAVDVGVAWVLMTSGEVPESGLAARLLGWGRSLLVKSFIDRFDRHQIGAVLREVVTWKVQDPHMSADEVAGMWRLVEHVEAAARRQR